MTIFRTLLSKALVETLKDERIGKYRAPELTTPQYGADHAKFGKRVYTTYSVLHSLNWTMFPDPISKFVDSKEWTKEQRAEHLNSVVGKHRRRVR